MSRDMIECAVAILAKAPIPGLAKTRLIPHLGAEGAAVLQAWLLQRTLSTAHAANLGPVTLWCAPDRSHPAFAEAAAQGVALAEQPAGDIGQRMQAAAGCLHALARVPSLPRMEVKSLMLMKKLAATVRSLEGGGETIRRQEEF
mgnify:CR=1 FL=1